MVRFGRSLKGTFLLTISLLLIVSVLTVLWDGRLYIDIFHRADLALHLQNNCRDISVFNTTVRHFPAKHESQNVTQMLENIRLCNQTERIAHMKKICEGRYDATKAYLLKPSPRSLVDHKHKLTFCWMSKAGGTSLKAFILEANGLDLSTYHGQGNSLNLVHFVATLNNYGVDQMYQFNDTKAKFVSEHYFNVMAIRHPFDRLVAYYRDKIVDNDRSSNHPNRAADILREFRPELFVNNKTLSNMKWPQEAIGLPTFNEVMTWVYRHKVMDEHWNFIFETCHPCAHDWGAILRVETMETDGQRLAKLVNSTRSRIPVRHSHENKTNYLQFGKTLNQFADLSDELVDYFLEFYRTDMKMFGYRWDRRTHTAYCAIETPNGWCC